MFPTGVLYACIAGGIAATFLVVLLDQNSIDMLKGLVSNRTGSAAALSKLQRTYLVVYLCAMLADWLQGPFVYALYQSYGISREDNAALFVAGFGSSAVFGTFIGSLADKHGRRNFAALYCILYFVSCLTKHVNAFSVLMLGRVTGGIATSLLFSVFDAWLVSEHNTRNLSAELGGSFSLAFFGNSIVAILAGELGQIMANLQPLTPLVGQVHYGGYTGPFDTADVCLLICLVLMMTLWSENFGQSSKEAASDDSGMQGAFTAICESPAILLCGLVCSLFESAMFIFVFNWTPLLMEDGQPDPPFGHIFAGFMIMSMLGSRLFSLATQFASIEQIGFGTLCMAAACHIAVVMSEMVVTRLFAFLIFEMCVGLYFPMMGTMKGKIVPESRRSTIYNLYRVPLNAIVVCTLLLKLNTFLSFLSTSGLLCVAALAQARLMSRRKDDLDLDKSPAAARDEESVELVSTVGKGQSSRAEDV